MDETKTQVSSYEAESVSLKSLVSDELMRDFQSYSPAEILATLAEAIDVDGGTCSNLTENELLALYPKIRQLALQTAREEGAIQ